MNKYTSINNLLNDNRVSSLLLKYSVEYKIPYKDLEVKSFLHFPRFSSSSMQNHEIITAEIKRLAQILEQRYCNPKFSFIKSDFRNYSLDKFSIQVVHENIANRIIENFHYLNSGRENSLHFALINKSNELICGIISISDFDLFHLDISGLEEKNVKVLSRLYTINNLPTNSTSFFIGQVMEYLRKNYPSVKLLLTYLNKNLNFSGTIYKATNWKEYAIEYETRYNYYKSNFVTDRFLLKHFGTINSDTLGKKSIDFEFSKFQLYPLNILSFSIKKTIKEILIQKVQMKR